MTIKEQIKKANELLKDKIMYPIEIHRRRREIGFGAEKKGNKYIIIYHTKVIGGYDIYAKTVEELVKQVNLIEELKEDE